MTNILTLHLTKPVLNSVLAALPTTRDSAPVLHYAALYRDGTLVATDRYSLIKVDPSAKDHNKNDDPVALLSKDALKALIRATPARPRLQEGTPYYLDLDDPQGAVFNIDQQPQAFAVTEATPDTYPSAKPSGYPRVLSLFPDDPTATPPVDPEAAGLSHTTLNTALKVCKALNQPFTFKHSTNKGMAFLNTYNTASKHTVTLVTMRVNTPK